ncbi:MAG TPA: outer membrane protein assembly factor BamA [Burkholderiales bacterium]|nr:outer membrane protein assembly factor BamA [Burkholderiales bacterium]
MRKIIPVVLLFCLFTAAAQAIEPFVIKDIRVEGIQRTEAGTIFSYLPVKVGDTMNDEKAAATIKSLFATGFFKDVRCEAENGVLIVIVQERPAISQIDIVGAKDISADDLKKGLKQVGLAESRIFDKALLERAEQELKRQYIGRGRYAATVSTTVTPLERNRVAITFNITEGDVAKIRQINIIGNRAFPEKELLDLFTLTTPGWFTFFTKNDQYSKQKLSADLETLRSFYLDRGYLEFNIDSTQVSITPSKADIYITISVTEGAKYTVSEVRLAGELLLPEDEFRKLIRIRPGEVFSREKLTESTKLISDRLGNDGYAFANVNAAPELNKQKRQVAFTFFIDPGRRVYVRRINISGNTRTRDEVIRRELRQLESGWYNADLINRSKQRIDKLGYFSDVNVETPAVPGTTDQVDVNYSVTEKPTGNILLGIGFSDAEGIIFNAAVTQSNIFGSGNYLSAQINTGKVNRVISVSFTNPYYTVDGVSLGFDVYKRNLDTTSLSVSPFKTSTVGGTARFGLPISEVDTISYGLGYEDTGIEVFSTSPQRYKDFVNQFGSDNKTILGVIGFTRDRRDSVIYTTSGTLFKFNAEVGLPGADLKYYKLSAQEQYYYPLSKFFTLQLGGEIGIGAGYNGQPLPFFKNFFAGGNNSVRGFETNSIGPKDTNGDALGDTHRIVGSAEVLFPVPGFTDVKALRLGTFVDAGTVASSFDFGSLRYSVGIDVAWTSPFGPIRFSIAQPIRKLSDDKIQRFQFTFGTTF